MILNYFKVHLKDFDCSLFCLWNQRWVNFHLWKLLLHIWKRWVVCFSESCWMNTSLAECYRKGNNGGKCKKNKSGGKTKKKQYPLARQKWTFISAPRTQRWSVLMAFRWGWTKKVELDCCALNLTTADFNLTHVQLHLQFWRYSRQNWLERTKDQCFDF